MNFLQRWYEYHYNDYYEYQSRGQRRSLPQIAPPVKLGSMETYYTEWITNAQWRHQCVVHEKLAEHEAMHAPKQVQEITHHDIVECRSQDLETLQSCSEL